MKMFCAAVVMLAGRAAVVMLAGCAGSVQPMVATGSKVRAPLQAERPAAGENVVYSFAGGSDGAYPDATLIASNGALYGTTSNGGNGGCRAVAGCGTAYRVSAAGQEHVIHVFKGDRDGEAPNASLIDVNGELFGTTLYGGGSGCKSGHVSGCGTIFELNPSGKERVLYRFTGRSQALPDSRLSRFKGALYGEAAAGGTGSCSYPNYPGCGTIFKLRSSGGASILYTFKGGTDAGTPQGGLMALNGNFYGTSSAGGSSACFFSYGCGTVFEITPAGTETILHAFTGSTGDGALPQSGLVILNGVLYGTTYSGGKYNCGVTNYFPCGTVFTVTLSGQERIIYNFRGGMDGAFPNQLVVLDGNVYGTTQGGGGGCNSGMGCGTVFKLTPSGKETILYRFKGGNDGSAPNSGLTDVGGSLYGTTSYGGTHNDGTVYSIAP